MASKDEQASIDQLLRPEERLGAYRIVKLLGEGGMGRVYQATDLLSHQPVALKVLHRKYTTRQDLLWRFYAEARATNKVRHENILEVKDFIEDKATHCHYIVMELLEGTDLQLVLEQETALPPRRATQIALQVASALATAHDAGVIHRDLKPENIYLLDREGRRDLVKILDFGVAKLVSSIDNLPEGLSPYQSWQGEVFGTPAYMSPEQACGRVVDSRTDIYSLGIILYEMLTGVVPFEGKSFGELLIKHTLMAPPRLSGQPRRKAPIPARLEALVLKCLEKSPDDRPQTMAAVHDELKALMTFIPPPVPST